MRKLFSHAVFFVLLAAFPLNAHAWWPDPGSNEVITVSGSGSHGAWDGGLAQYNLPMAVFGDGAGGLFVADTFNNMIRHISASGEVTNTAGFVSIMGPDNFPAGAYIDGPLAEAGFRRPTGIAVSAGGSIFVADSGNDAIRVIAGGEVFTFSGGDGIGHTDGAPDRARFNMPGAVAMHPNGNLYVADTGNHVIRRITPDGVASTIAGQAGSRGYSNGDARNARFDSPMGIAISPDGRIFVADTGNHVIRAIQNGTVSTFAGTQVNAGEGLSEWDIYPEGGFADGMTGHAMFNQPMGLALWGDYLIVADSANHSIRTVSSAGEVRTLTGTGEPGSVFGLAYFASFHFPSGVYVHGDRLYIADTGNNMIRAVYLRGQ